MFDIVIEEYLRKSLRSKHLFIQAHLLLPRAAACTFSGSMHIDSAQANDMEIKSCGKAEVLTGTLGSCRNLPMNIIAEGNRLPQISSESVDDFACTASKI
jgi:hypothetical protein